MAIVKVRSKDRFMGICPSCYEVITVKLPDVKDAQSTVKCSKCDQSVTVRRKE